MREWKRLCIKRHALLIGDAGAVCTRLSGRRVESHCVLAGTLEENIEGARHWLAQAPEVPVVALFDTLGQAYRRERVPPANLLDRGKIVARKLEVLFPGSELTGGLHVGAAEGAARGVDYLFAAITESPEIAAWRELLESIENPVDDARLVPVESAALADRLFDQLPPGASGSNGWRMLISHHHTGGVRQLVVRKGKLAMTRMTPTSLDPDNADDFGPFIRREVAATIDYITRLGFDRADGLDAIFIGAANVCAAVEAAQLPVRQLSVITPAAAGEVLGITGAANASDHFADVLLAAWGAHKLLAALSVWPSARRRARLADLGQALGARVLSAASVAAAIYAAFLGWSLHGLQQELEAAETARMASERRYEAEVSRLDAGPVPLAQVQDALSAYRQMAASAVDVDTLLGALDGAVGRQLRLRAFLMQFDQRTPALAETRPGNSSRRANAVQIAAASKVEGEVLLVVDLASFDEPEAAVAETERLAERFADTFPKMRTSIVRQPLQILPEDTFQVKFGETGMPLADLERVAEIQLRGEVK